MVEAGNTPKIGSLEGITKVPPHVAIIMDGNGRWAQRRGLPRIAGHRAGTDNIRPILESCVDYGIKILTVYAFSTENWSRPLDEVRGLMGILGEVIKRETKALHKKGVRLRHIGRLEDLPPGLVRGIQHAVELTRNNEAVTLNVALNYGGRREIVDAVRRIVSDGVDPQRIDEELVSKYLYTGDQPDPDLIIRTGGEMRLSNFLIWQSAYAEYYSTPVYWPDFDVDQLRLALLAYSQRQRRFGKV